jgi:hypothetical protein
MRPELRSIWSPDLPDGELPADPTKAWVAVQAEIGAHGSQGADTFSLVVATPHALTDLGLPRWGHGLLLIESFDWSVVRSALEKVLRHCEAEDWDGIAAKICRNLDWEFDDYAEFAPGPGV